MIVISWPPIVIGSYMANSTPSAISGTTETFVPNHALGQCWYASVGIKYLFN